MSFLKRPFWIFLAVALLTLVMGRALLAAPFGTEGAPVEFTAKNLSHDDQNQIVTATGDVELVQGAQILRADKIVYYLAEDRVHATGNVSLLDETGGVHFAEEVELKKQMKEGFVKSLLSMLADGSRFTAEEGTREKGGTVTSMTNASYTSCHVCEADPNPVWQIRASKVVHDAEAKTVKYDNARLEFLGVPIAYSPIFSHPDPTLKQKSGFLRPGYGWTAELGAHITGGYYFALAPHRDATLQVMPTALAGTLVQGEWRERFQNGVFEISGGIVNSDREEEDGRVETDRTRGHVFARGLMDFSDTWRGGLNVARASDKEYLRLYDISDEDVLQNQIYAERFSGRDYTLIRALNFQDVRLGIRPEQPDLLPMMEHRMLGEPGSFLGGRWEAGASTLGLIRGDNNQSVFKGGLDLGWKREDILTSGLVTTMALNVRGDFYNVTDSDASKINPAFEADFTKLRGNATASLTSSYPLVRRFDDARAVIEPVAGINISPNVTGFNNRNIPNEDSIDIQFDTNSLFIQNRYPGEDKQEDGGRFNYGLKTGIHGDDGKFAKVYLGQSYRFSGDNTFPTGSGLEDRVSDVVGQIKVGVSDRFEGDYRFQLDQEGFSARRHEARVSGRTDDIRLESRYIYIDPVAGTGFLEPREQVQVAGEYDFMKNWTYSAGTLMDFGDEPGLRNASTGLHYQNECFTFSVAAARTVADDASGEDDTKILFRVGLRNIGEFSAPKISLGRGKED